MGPRNPAARGFSPGPRTCRPENRAGLPRAGAVRPHATPRTPDAFDSRPKDAAAGWVAQARRPEGRRTAGGRWRAPCASPVVSRSASGPSPGRGVARPEWPDRLLLPRKSGQGVAGGTRRPVRTPPGWSGGRGPPLAAPGPSEAGGSRRSTSVTHPTRLETRTKECNMRASQWVLNRPRGAMKAKAGGRRPSWDPRPRPRRTNDPSRPARRWGGVRARTLRPERW